MIKYSQTGLTKFGGISGEDRWRLAGSACEEPVERGHREITGGRPQAITRHGERVAVVVSIEEFERLDAAPKTSLLDFLKGAPLGEIQLPERDRNDAGREVEF